MQTRNGFGENIITGVDVSDKDTKAMRLSLGVFPDGDTFDAKLELDYTQDLSGVRGAQMLVTNRFDPSVPDSPVLEDRYDVRSGFYPDNSTTAGGASFVASWRPTDNWSFKSISAWRKSALFNRDRQSGSWPAATRRARGLRPCDRSSGPRKAA